MTEQFDIRTTDMPSEMQTLLRDYPRDSWDAHPGFAEKTRHWLGAHQMFRQLAAVNLSETQSFLDRSRDPEAFAGRLSYYGDALVRNLHGHHHWEDHSYFPELAKADPRFQDGLDILESDHVALNAVLDSFVTSANRVIKLVHLDEKQAREETGALLQSTKAIQSFLARHLGDEEDLAVPIILHHRLRG